MFVVRRWWERRGVPIALGGLVLAAAWGIRQDHGGAIAELYYWLSRPFLNETTLIGPTILTNARIEELEQRLFDLEQRNRRLQALLGYTKTQARPGVVAPVVGRSGDAWWQQVLLGQGHQAGIQTGDIVAGTGGLVGRVIDVTANTSRVLLISDPSSRLGATVSRSGQMGFVVGTGSQVAVMRFFDKATDVRIGDVIATSSVSRLYPAGIPVGRVVALALDKSPAPEVTLQLSAPLNYLEWTAVYPAESESANNNQR